VSVPPLHAVKLAPRHHRLQRQQKRKTELFVPAVRRARLRKTEWVHGDQRVWRTWQTKNIGLCMRKPRWMQTTFVRPFLDSRSSTTNFSKSRHIQFYTKTDLLILLFTASASSILATWSCDIPLHAHIDGELSTDRHYFRLSSHGKGNTHGRRFRFFCGTSSIFTQHSRNITVRAPFVTHRDGSSTCTPIHKFVLRNPFCQHIGTPKHCLLAWQADLVH
jgi:hypothetical protein